MLKYVLVIINTMLLHVTKKKTKYYLMKVTLRGVISVVKLTSKVSKISSKIITLLSVFFINIFEYILVKNNA